MTSIRFIKIGIMKSIFLWTIISPNKNGTRAADADIESIKVDLLYLNLTSIEKCKLKQTASFLLNDQC